MAPRTPDLTHLDFYLWGYRKSNVYFSKPNDLEEVKCRSWYEVRQIPPEIIRNDVINEFVFRPGYCQDVQGNKLCWRIQCIYFDNFE